MANQRVTALTELSVPAGADLGLLVGAAGSQRLRVDQLGGMLNPQQCNGRLTLESGVPISTTDQAARTTVYFTPYEGNRLACFDGAGAWRSLPFSELSLALGTGTAGALHDVFAHADGGTPALEASAAWASTTARSEALGLQDGVRVKAGNPTRRYLGTFQRTTTTATEDSRANRLLYNATNPVLRYGWRQDAATYTCAGVVTGTEPDPYALGTTMQVGLVLGAPQHVQVCHSVHVNAGTPEYWHYLEFISGIDGMAPEGVWWEQEFVDFGIAAGYPQNLGLGTSNQIAVPQGYHVLEILQLPAEEVGKDAEMSHATIVVQAAL
jgi:hypothetical protein